MSKKKHNCEFYHSKIEKLTHFPQKIYKLSKTNTYTGCPIDQYSLSISIPDFSDKSGIVMESEY